MNFKDLPEEIILFILSLLKEWRN